MRSGQDVGQRGGCGFTADLPRSEWVRLIDEWVFSERDRDILKRRLLDGVTFAALAVEFEISEAQIKRITRRGLEILTKHI